MQKEWYDKLHSFRLTKDDERLFLFLERIPRNKKSEQIRKMLLFALDHIEEIEHYSRKKDDSLDLILDKLNKIDEKQTYNYQLLLKKLDKGIVLEQKEEENVINEETISDTTSAMLDVFGIDFD